MPIKNKKVKLIEKITVVDEKPKIIGVCTSGTGGVKSATYSLTPNVFEVPRINSLAQSKKIADAIIKYNPEKVVIGGYHSGYDLLAKSLKAKKPSVRIFLISHASFTWYHGRSEEVKWLERIFKVYEEGCIEKIGFVKKDAAVYFKDKGVNSFFIMNRFPKLDALEHKLNKKNPQIGVWGTDMWHRNILNQAVGALMLKNTNLHINQLPNYFFLDNDRIRRYGVLPKENYYKLLNKMDVNLYIGFTDCFPMTVIESLKCSIPCVVSNTSEIYNGNEYLEKMLVENKIDSPVAIEGRIENILNNYNKVQKEIAVYLPLLEKKIEESITRFLK